MFKLLAPACGFSDQTYKALNLALFCNWEMVFCILTAVLKQVFERSDIEEDEDFGLYYTRSGHDFQN
jgi:hypothetical protein